MILALIEWDATVVVLLGVAMVVLGVQILLIWRTNLKVIIIEQHTNGMTTALQHTRDTLADELRDLKAANLAALTAQRDRAETTVEEQAVDLLRRADAAAPTEKE